MFSFLRVTLGQKIPGTVREALCISDELLKLFARTITTHKQVGRCCDEAESHIALVATARKKTWPPLPRTSLYHKEGEGQLGEEAGAQGCRSRWHRRPRVWGEE